MKEKLQNVSEVALPLRPPNCICNKAKLIANALLCSNSFEYAKRFPQFLTDPVFLLLFYFSTLFYSQSGALLKMLPLYLSTEEFVNKSC